MNIRKPMLYCAAFIVCITLLVGCGEEEQAASSTFFDAIEASAERTASAQFDDEAGERQQSMQLGLETEKEEAVNLESEKRDAGQQQDVSMHDAAKEQLTASTTDAVDHSRIENKNQTVEMSLKEIQARKMSAAAAEQAQADQIEAGSSEPKDSSSGSSSDESGSTSSNMSYGESSNAASAASSGEPSSPLNEEKSSTVIEEVNSTPSGEASPVANNVSSSNTSSSKTPSSKSSDTSSTVSTKGKNEIYWSEFFDNEDQTTPSNTFWDLSEKSATVQIKGFMGEVLSLDKNWFLLIPEPGAECPFDNGDETYWNKIMIVFVDEDVKLRYTSKPLQLTGKLDVGIKVDESGYKTMFRLYDATFTEI